MLIFSLLIANNISEILNIYNKYMHSDLFTCFVSFQPLYKFKFHKNNLNIQIVCTFFAIYLKCATDAVLTQHLKDSP